MSHHGYNNPTNRFVGDEEFSENEYVPDGQMVLQAPDLTELYRRKQIQARNYYPLHPGYYESVSPRSRLVEHPQTCTCNNQSVDPRYHNNWYATNQLNESLHRSHEGMVYNNNSPIIQSPGGKSRRENGNPNLPYNKAMKKYPVTVRTPRYCRGVPPLYKRPSTLCLPVTCQPDPGTHRRPRKPTTTSYHQCYHHDPEIVTYTTKKNRTIISESIALPPARPIDSEGDVNSRLNDLENLLTKFNDDDDDDDDDDGDGAKCDVDDVGGMTSLSDMAKTLKPKVPASIVAKQERIARMQSSMHNSDVNNSTRSSRTNDGGTVKKDDHKKEDSLDALIRHLSNDNLKDGESHKTESSPRATDNNEHKDFFLPMSTNGEKRFSRNFSDVKPSLDDNSALELHRSKSYIVSLIDKALSKELGTVPGDKCSRQEFMNMNPKRAVDLMNRHTFKKSSDVPAATDSNILQKKDSECICKMSDISYLKHLRNMRWTHLRQIQREARRLTDLERLLDSLSDGDQ